MVSSSGGGGSVLSKPSSSAADNPHVFGGGDAAAASALSRDSDEHKATIIPAQTLAKEALILERRISDLVNDAFGLTPDDVDLMWETAPPRMPIPRL